MAVPFPVKTTSKVAFKGRSQALDYFEELIWQYHQGEEPCKFLPSLMGLSKSLDCSTLDIQCALIELRKQGYDFFMMDIEGPITLWCPSKISLIPEHEPVET